MPVMVWGICICRKRYGFRDWIAAAAVTMGVTEFLMTGPTAAPNVGSNSARGLAWLLAFLALDGLTSTMQEKLFKDHKMTLSNQMLYVNLLSCCVSVITLVSSGTLRPALHFCQAHAELVLDASLLSGSAVASQFFIYSQVKEFGALVFAATMNVRQMVSIMVSYVAYGHSITTSQVCGLALVFFALFFKSYSSLIALGSEKQPLLGQVDEEAVMHVRPELNLRLAELQKD
mmetsp:Transcript_98088/g.293087  ORF Transcript_98088/g.293087 Transcript_98088/m.293087 type:complete len:231 (+) Transcript_98088:1-693(+)